MAFKVSRHEFQNLETKVAALEARIVELEQRAIVLTPPRTGMSWPKDENGSAPTRSSGQVAAVPPVKPVMPPTVVSMPRLAYSIAESEAATGLSRATLYRLMDRGLLRTVKFGGAGGRRLIPVEELNRLCTPDMMSPRQIKKTMDVNTLLAGG